MFLIVDKRGKIMYNINKVFMEGGVFVRIMNFDDPLPPRSSNKVGNMKIKNCIKPPPF
ncbi:MAG: hypothetical protein FWG70_02080 [Oscillospiraceae bacterium]|nr:hypothetical protein [Oscillospiraceae bacterium]